MLISENHLYNCLDFLGLDIDVFSKSILRGSSILRLELLFAKGDSLAYIEREREREFGTLVVMTMKRITA